MPTAHMYIFADGCPTDWLTNGHDEYWHTIAYFAFQSDPTMLKYVENGIHFNRILNNDLKFLSIFARLEKAVPNFKLEKWKGEKRQPERYRSKFRTAFRQASPNLNLQINAISFQEKTLRAAKLGLLEAYNKVVQPDRTIGFEQYLGSKREKRMRHQRVDGLNGYTLLDLPENKMLVMLLIAWVVNDQYNFYRRNILQDKRLGFDNFAVTLISDKLSGDTEVKAAS
jgi:hypothetical protein